MRSSPQYLVLITNPFYSFKNMCVLKHCYCRKFLFVRLLLLYSFSENKHIMADLPEMGESKGWK